jgi:hypothetical protein
LEDMSRMCGCDAKIAALAVEKQQWSLRVL